MGFVNTEQTTAIIESVAKVVDAANPDTVTQPQPEPNYWWALSLVIIPVVLGWWLNKRKKP
jgi:hypothetical protein